MYGDGYCIIESIRKFLRNVGRHINKSVFLNKTKEEALCRIGYYKRFMILEDTDPLGEMSNYIKNGIYESDIGNMILHVVANLQSFSPLLSTDK